MRSALLSLPPRARAFLCACLGAGALAAAGGAWAAWPAGPLSPEAGGTLAGAGLLVVVLFFLQVHSPALNWRGKTIGVNLDEGVVLVGFVVLPAPVVVVSSVAGTLASQAFLRKPPVKTAFNASVQALAVGAAALLFHAVERAGVPAAGASTVVPFAMSGVGLSLVAVLMSLLEGEPARRAFKPALLGSITLASLAGATFGILALGLYAFHPVAVSLLLPLGFLLRQSVVSEYRHQNELTTRRALQDAHERLVTGGPDEDAIVAAGFTACEEALDLLSCEVRLGERAWRVDPRAPAGPTRLLGAPLLDGEGRHVGELRATVAWNGGLRLKEDETTVALLASSLSMALATAAALRSMREARQGLRDVLDAAREPIVAWDAEGRLVHRNEAARLLFGDVTRDRVADLLDPGSADAYRLAMSAPPSEPAEVEARTRAGRMLEMRRTPITLSGGGIGALLVARDVTERRRLERDARAHHEMMTRAERLASLGILAAGVAHEVNSPLMAIQGNLEVTILDIEDVEAERKDERLTLARDQLSTALASVDRIQRITRGLGALGRPDRTPPSRGVDIRLSVERGVAEARRAVAGAPEPEVTMGTDPLPVVADPSDLRQVTDHLVRNALEAAGPDGRVRVRVERRGDAVDLTVEDDGPGVPPEERAKLFTPFHTTKPEGTGLGLPIALALAKSIGGDLVHEPRAQGGAVFRATFPLAPRIPGAQEVF